MIVFYENYDSHNLSQKYYERLVTVSTMTFFSHKIDKSGTFYEKSVPLQIPTTCKEASKVETF